MRRSRERNDAHDQRRRRRATRSSIDSSVTTNKLASITIDGGPGDDQLLENVSSIPTTFIGGPGNDLIVGHQTVNDTVSYANATGPVNVNLRTGVATGDGTDTLFSGFGIFGLHNVIGSTHDDTIEGDASDNTLDGRAGTDTLSYAGAPGAVNATLNGTVTGDGTDTTSGFENVVGSANNDTITGDTGDNVLDGGPGADTIHGQDGADTLIGGTGRRPEPRRRRRLDDAVDYSNAPSGETVTSAPATRPAATAPTRSTASRTSPGPASSTTHRHGRRQRDLGGAGNDTIGGAGGADTLGGGTGDDNISETGSDDGAVLNGDAGDDTLSGGAATADDALNGGDGNDILKSGGANDAIDGGPGTNTVDYSNAGAGVNVDLQAHTASGDGNDTLANVQNANGSSHDDQLNGDAGANALDGKDGNDTLVGRGGDDTLNGGAGAGGGADDVTNYSRRRAPSPSTSRTGRRRATAATRSRTSRTRPALPSTTR